MKANDYIEFITTTITHACIFKLHLSGNQTFKLHLSGNQTMTGLGFNKVQLDTLYLRSLPSEMIDTVAEVANKSISVTP